MKPIIRSALFTGAALAAFAVTPNMAQAASMTDAGLDKRVSDLEREVALLKNRLKTAKDCDCDRIVRSGNSRVKVSFYGQVSRAVRIAIGRRNFEVTHVDNDSEESHLGIAAEGRISPDLKILANIEFFWTENGRSGTDNTNDGNLTVAAGAVDLAFDHAKLGKLFLGYGDPASADTATQDFSGTDLVFGAGGCNDDGGLRFGPRNGNQSAGLTLGAACNNFEGDTENRIMYESPSLGGFSLKASHGEGNKFEAGLFYEGAPIVKSLKVAGAIGYQYSPGAKANAPGNGRGNANTYTGSFAMLHEPTGLSVQVSGGMNVAHGIQGAPRGAFYYVKAGWQGTIWSVGKTYASVDFGQYDHVTADVHAYAVGFAVVQDLDGAASSVYVGIRYQDAKRGGVGQDGLLTLITGAIIRF